MLDNLTNLAGSVLGGSGNGIMGKLMNMTDLDEKAIAMVEAEFGKDKVDTLKMALADGSIDKNDIGMLAEKFGMPEMVVQLLLKYFNK